ncbi:hypothetical protein CPB85DRAFT_1436801 [Mucidula mucida]|nr:hypothetical protein CPB85DRAFT_1436801 [Mucidula mucida]
MPKASTTKDTTRKQSKRQQKSTASAVEPKKRRVRRKLAAAGGIEVSDASGPVALLRRPSLPPDANTKGLPTLPVELHLEIISYLPSVPIPCLQSGILCEEYRIKFDTMFAISQTCRVLYHLFKPLLWETLEACALNLPRTGCTTGRPKAMATELVLWLEVVSIRAPALANYVRVFNVALTAFSSRNVYQEFTRCLQLLPNLHTLQIVSFPDSHEKDKCLWHLSGAFKGGISLPTVHTVTIPQCIYERIVASDGPRIFPNLRHLSLTKISTAARYRYCITDKPCTQEIHSLQLSIILQLGELGMQSLISLFPHLRVTPQIYVPYQREAWLFEQHESEEEFTARYIPKAQKAFQALSRLTRLHTIVLDDDLSTAPVVMERVCDMAKKLILRNLGREENVDVVEGKVRWCHGEEWAREMRVLRPVNED